jgi:hypothetical protein
MLVVMAEDIGFEPMIPVKVCQFSRLVHSTTLPIFPYGGVYWVRTSDPLLAKQVLSQLS